MASTPYSSGPRPSPADKRREQAYQAEDDFRTLERAEEVRVDPTRHQRAIGHGRKRVGAIKRVIIGGRAASRARARKR